MNCAGTYSVMFSVGRDSTPPARRAPQWRVVVVRMVIPLGLVTVLLWAVMTDRQVGWTGIRMGSPVTGPVAVLDSHGQRVAFRNLDGSLTAGVEERFEVGPGSYSVIVCQGRGTGFEITFKVVVLPGMHTTVWNERKEYASAFAQPCSS